MEQLPLIGGTAVEPIQETLQVEQEKSSLEKEQEEEDWLCPLR